MGERVLLGFLGFGLKDFGLKVGGFRVSELKGLGVRVEEL